MGQLKRDEIVPRGVAGAFVTCPACGGRSQAGKKFCGDCGAELAVVSPESRAGIESRPAPQTILRNRCPSC